MHRFLCLVLLAQLGLLAVAQGEEDSTTYYVQLVRGTDDDKPPAPQIKAIGPKVSKMLHSVFRCKNYWEMNRIKVAVAKQQKKKVRVSKEREVEIDLSTDSKRKVTVFKDGQSVSSTTVPAGQAMTIIGGDREMNTAWFIVVRRDKPADE